ncbi:MAG: aspartate aminotransferase family protein [Chakrabartia sp.]
MIDRARIAALRAQEEARFIVANPKSMAHADARAAHWHQGVPFHWMRDWPSPFPLVAAHAKGAVLTSVDGQQLDDFCLGDTAAMFGHSPDPVSRAIAEQAGRGLSYMLPTADVEQVGALLAERFGLPFWQVTTTASEANRAVIRWCRGITGRKKILIFNGCYHGAVDDVFVDLRSGIAETRRSLVGQVHDVTDHTVAIEFNDIAALEAALVDGEVACVLAEPVMTNVGMVLPDPGFLEAVRNVTARTGTLLVWDETHTISSGYGGHSGTYGPKGDMFVIGKSIGGGVPCAAYGFSATVAERMIDLRSIMTPGHSGIGTTLSANALAITAMHAMLGDVMTHGAYAHMTVRADELVAGLGAVIARHALPWHIANVGARVELICAQHRPRNGTEARAAMDHELESLIHLFLINRGSLLAPFHNMMLVSPATTANQITRLTAHFEACVSALMS